MKGKTPGDDAARKDAPARGTHGSWAWDRPHSAQRQATPQGYAPSAAGDTRWSRDAIRLAGAEGELLLARVRLLVCGLLLIMPTYNLVNAPQYPPFFWGFCVTLVANATAVFFYLYSKSRSYHPLVGFVSSAFDVSLVSTALLLFMLTTSPLVALNNRPTFEMYFLAIAATSIRCDKRTVIAAGSLAVVQYASLVLYARTAWSLDATQFRGQPQGDYNEGDQVTRLILLSAAVIIASAIVARAGRLVQLATSDGLTGVLNRVAFDGHLDREVARARRYGKHLSLAMLDTDRFKEMNDTHGHAAGDGVLRQIGCLLHDAVREADIVARYGGDEFVILLPETSAREAIHKLESLRCRVEELFAAAHGASGVTMSVGVSCHPQDGGSAEALLGAADARLLESKRGGRNRVTGPASLGSRCAAPANI